MWLDGAGSLSAYPRPIARGSTIPRPRRYDRRSGIGTVIALVLPYIVVLAVALTIFFLASFALGLSWGIWPGGCLGDGSQPGPSRTAGI